MAAQRSDRIRQGRAAQGGAPRGRPTGGDGCAADPARSRIIEATFGVLVERGYAGANTREIARRAKVSKRELYALFGSKQGILAAMIAARAQRMRMPLALPDVRERGELLDALIGFGTAVVREVSDPAVIALFRLAIGEAGRSLAIARALDAGGRKANRAALADFLARAQARGLIGSGDSDVMAGQFLALLWGELLLLLLAGLAPRPAPQAIDRRARDAAQALLALHPRGDATLGRQQDVRTPR